MLKLSVAVRSSLSSSFFFPLLLDVTHTFIYQLQDGGVQLSNFGLLKKKISYNKRSLEAEILVNNLSLYKIFIVVKKINGHSGVNFSFILVRK